MNLPDDRPLLESSGVGTASETVRRLVAAFGSQSAGELSRSSVRQCRLLAVVKQPEDDGEPDTFITSAQSLDSVKK